VLAALHEPLVDDLCGIVPARLDVYALLHDRVRSGPQNLAGLVPARLDDGAMLGGRHVNEEGGETRLCIKERKDCGYICLGRAEEEMITEPDGGHGGDGAGQGVWRDPEVLHIESATS
jgi:hypothetical protein